MRYEVEQKHRVDDGWDLAIRLAAYGGKLDEPVYQSDRYFAHPARDFAKTDEALRIRTQGVQSFVTYKGPKLDKTTKTRREIELSLDAPGVGPKRFTELLEALGFSTVATVTKERRHFQLEYAGWTVSGAYDVVSELGAFVELEVIVEEAQLDEARRIIADLATKLELGPGIRSSYLELLLAMK